MNQLKSEEKYKGVYLSILKKLWKIIPNLLENLNLIT